MGDPGLPDDWGAYRFRCGDCGQWYHASGTEECACVACEDCGYLLHECDCTICEQCGQETPAADYYVPEGLCSECLESEDYETA